MKRIAFTYTITAALILGALILFCCPVSASANSGHNGTEQALSKLVAQQALGNPGSRAGLQLSGGTPNHKALAAAAAYGWGLKTPADLAAGRAKVLEFLRGQLRAYMAVGGVSEFETSSHFSWWQAAYYGIWLQAARAQDAEVLPLIRRLVVQQMTVESACSTPDGHVVIPGGRAFLGAGESDQRKQRDQGLALLQGRKVRLPAEIADPHEPPASTDRIGLWLLTLIPPAELQVVRGMPAEMPSVLDPLQIQRSAGGHVAWFDTFTGMRPAYFAWVDYRTGDERYGVDPSWPKGQPGGRRPEGMVVPAAPGGSVVKVWKLGTGGAQATGRRDSSGMGFDDPMRYAWSGYRNDMPSQVFLAALGPQPIKATTVTATLVNRSGPAQSNRHATFQGGAQPIGHVGSFTAASFSCNYSVLRALSVNSIRFERVAA